CRRRLPDPTARWRWSRGTSWCPDAVPVGTAVNCSARFDGDAVDVDLVLRNAAAGAGVRAGCPGLGHVLEDIQPGGNCPEWGVTGRQLAVLEDQEELAAVAVGGAAVGHRDRAGLVGGAGQVLAGVLVSRAAGAKGGGRAGQGLAGLGGG